MKKFIKDIRKKLHNAGSGIVLVIVALGFVGILTGALLTAVAYAYRLKIYDYNAKDNYYYLEQAMDEIYAQVGSKTVENLQSAYEDTLENAVKFNSDTLSYENIGNDEANKMFKNKFMDLVKSDPNFTFDTTDPEKGLPYLLTSCISNSSVKLDVSKLDVKRNTDADGSLVSISIRHVTLIRSVDYNRAVSKNKYTQTISADIVIDRPDFDVNFDTVNSKITTLFDYAMIADSGVEINEPNPQNILTINGNIYAASDFYNKKYNNYDGKNSSDYAKGVSIDGTSSGDLIPMNAVSDYKYSESAKSTAELTLFNKNAYQKALNKVNSGASSTGVSSNSYLYDGKNDRSKYSGLYIDNSNVNILASRIIVPGSIAVMNKDANLTLFGRTGTNVSSADVWADELVFAGDSSSKKEGTIVNYSSPKALINANMHIKDDTSFETDGSSFKLFGNYYGYSNSTTSDDRQFIPTTAKNSKGTYIYQDGDGKNRGHFNSSAIVVNGQYSSIDLSNAGSVYIAGRAYIELSKHKDSVTAADGTQTTTYSYDASTGDYKTGESVSTKSNQIAYVQSGVSVPFQDTKTTGNEYFATLPTNVSNSKFFRKYFGNGASGVYPGGTAGEYKPTSTTVPVAPVLKYTNGKKDNYYLDFKYAYDNKLYDTKGMPDVKSGDDLSAAFIKDYFDILKYVGDYSDMNATKQAQFRVNHTDVDSTILDVKLLKDLKDITNYSDFVAGQITVADLNDNASSTGSGSASGSTSGSSTSTSSKVYGSGVITTSDSFKKSTAASEKSQVFDSNANISFSVTTSKDTISDSFGSTSDNGKTVTKKSEDTSSASKAIDLSTSYQNEYNYLKWSLEELPAGSDEAKFVDKLTSTAADGLGNKYGEASITPINYYLNFDQINTGVDATNIYPGKRTDSNASDTNILDIGNSYKIWVSGGDVHIKAEKEDNHVVTGMIYAKGDVYFDNDASDADGRVDQFNGIIVTGGKIYINGNQTSINSSLLCKNMINSCMSAARETAVDASGNAKFTNNALNAQKVLSLFKVYKPLVDKMQPTKVEDDDVKEITNIDYSDVIRYENWMKKVD